MEDENLLDNELAGPSTNVNSPATFSKKLILKFGICHGSTSTDAVTHNNNTTDDNSDEATSPSTSGVALSRELANQALDEHLVTPLRQIFKEKAKANAKCEYLHSCIAKNSFPKGTITSVPLKIIDAPDDLKKEWLSQLQDCARKLTQLLVKYHHSQIARQEQLAESVITDASHIIIPEHITNVPDIPVMIESSIQDVLCESSLMSRSLRKRASKGKTPINNKRPKITPTPLINQSRSSTSSDAVYKLL